MAKRRNGESGLATRSARIQNFRANRAAAARPVPRIIADRLIERIDRLEEVADVIELVDLVAV